LLELPSNAKTGEQIVFGSKPTASATSPGLFRPQFTFFPVVGEPYISMARSVSTCPLVRLRSIAKLFAGLLCKSFATFPDGKIGTSAAVRAAECKNESISRKPVPLSVGSM
jgi:hypothetical protein